MNNQGLKYKVKVIPYHVEIPGQGKIHKGPACKVVTDEKEGISNMVFGEINDKGVFISSEKHEFIKIENIQETKALADPERLGGFEGAGFPPAPGEDGEAARNSAAID
jgi:hypothetical protein